MNRSGFLAAASSACAIALVLAGCDTGGDGDATGRLTMSVTDTPVDEATAVVVEFTGLELKPAGAAPFSIDFDSPRQIDLLAMQGGTSEALISNEEVPAGDYDWVRLKVNAERAVLDSYISLEDGSQHPLYIPSGAETGLKLVTGFVVPVNGSGSYTIDFDLRKSVHLPEGLDGDYALRPALRLLDDTQVGAIEGMVSDGLINDASCTSGNAVYVFEGSVTPDDVDGDGTDPVASAIVELNPDNGQYEYRVAFLLTGQYTAAYTCNADDDDPAVDDASVSFLASAPVEVQAGQTTTQNF